MTRLVWICFGWICVGLAAVGVALPLLPTVPFLLLAAFAFSKSSPRFHDWLINHPTFGPPIEAWNTQGAISTRAKVMAVIAMALSVLLTVFLDIPTWVLIIQLAVLCLVCLFILTRPRPE